jgi:hypothetical protein
MSSKVVDYLLLKSNNKNSILDYDLKIISNKSNDFKYLSIIDKVYNMRKNSNIQYNSIYYQKANMINSDYLRNLHSKSIKDMGDYTKSYINILSNQFLGDSLLNILKRLPKQNQFKIISKFKENPSMKLNIRSSRNKDKEVYYVIPKDFIKLKNNKFRNGLDLKMYTNMRVNDINLFYSKEDKKYYNRDIKEIELIKDGYVLFDSRDKLLEYIGSQLLLTKLKVNKSKQNIRRYHKQIDKVGRNLEIDRERDMI